MTLAKPHLGSNKGKRKLTTLELLLVAGFILFLAYMSLEPLVLPAGSASQGRASVATVATVATVAPPTSVAAAPAIAPAAPVAPVAPLQSATAPTDPAANAAEQNTVTAAAGQNVAPTQTVKGIKAVFVVTADSTVLERIAPIATVVIEEPAIATATADAAAVPAAAAPVVPAVPEPAKADAAPAPAAAVQPAPVVAETPKQAGALRFEIADATGVDGLAKEVAQALEKSGMSTATVASIPGKQRRTVILFRDGFEGEAKRLGKLFVHAPALVRTANEGADVKLVLGSAAAREKNLLDVDGRVPKLSLGGLARSQ